MLQVELPSHRDRSSPQEGHQKGSSRGTAKYSRSISPPQSVSLQVSVFQGELHCLPQGSAVSGQITQTNDAKREKSLPHLIAEDHKYQDQGKGAVSQEHLLFSPTSVLWLYGKGSSSIPREGEKSFSLVAVTPRGEHNGSDMSLPTAGSFPELAAARLPPTSEGALASQAS